MPQVRGEPTRTRAPSYARRNTGTGLKWTGLIITIIMGFALMYGIAAWFVMISVGMIHADWLHTMPTMSYHAALVLMIPISIVLGLGAAATHSSSS